MLGDFKQRHSKGPDVRRDGVRLASDSFWGHIVRCANEGVGVALCSEFTTDTEVAKLDLAVAAQENVGRFDVCRPLVIISNIDQHHAFIPRWMIFRL